MKNKVNSSETVNPVSLHYPYPYFVPIKDGDEDTIKYYRNHQVPVAHIALPGRLRHYYAVFNADTEEVADFMNRMYNNWAKKDARDKAVQDKFETSYDAMVENGYDQKADFNNLEEIVVYKAVINALKKALDELPEGKFRACRMVADNEPQRQVATELGISRRTLRERKDSAMDELRKKMKDYR